MTATLQPGTSIGHFRVIALLGAGGMGEVYKAHDLKLERVVALKILPPELVRHEERLRRFMQEARSASSLNHPNIVTIHEIGEAAYRKDVQDGPSVMRLGVVPLAGGPPAIDLPFNYFSGDIRWNAKRNEIDFVRPGGTALNVYAQPLSGGNPRQLSAFEELTITSFDWTPDEKLIVAGGPIRQDVVLISGFR